MSSQPPLLAKRRSALVGWLSACAVALGFAIPSEQVLDFVRPLRIASGSMAPALSGPSECVVCDDCRFSYRAGMEWLPDSRPLICPNCGCPQRGLRERGQRVRLAPRFEPARWDIVAVAAADPSCRWQVKRIIGLPGEQVAIAAGDILINGKRLQKDLASLLEVAILVHDDRFRPSESAPFSHRWQPAQRRSGWSAIDDGYRWTQPTTAETACDPASDDWLVYHHVGHRPPGFGRGTRLPIDDEYAYNQNLSRRLHVVRDVFVVMEVGVSLGDPEIKADGNRQPSMGVQGKIACGWLAGSLPICMTCDRTADELRLTCGDVTTRLPIDEHRGLATFTGKLLFGTWDGQIVVAWDHQMLFCQDYCQDYDPDSEQLTTQEITSREGQVAATHPFRFATSIPGLSVTSVRVYRDIYYTHPHDLDQPWRARRLRDDEYLLLGDNSPISQDARHGTGQGMVTRSQLVGRVRPWSSE